MFITELLRRWMGNCQFFIWESPKTKGLSGKIMNNSYFSNLIKDNKILTHGFRKYCGPAGRPIGGAATDAWIFFYSSGYGWQPDCLIWVFLRCRTGLPYQGQSRLDGRPGWWQSHSGFPGKDLPARDFGNWFQGNMVYIDPQLAGLTWTVADEPDLCLWICAAGFVLALLIQCLAFCFYIGYNQHQKAVTLIC